MFVYIVQESSGPIVSAPLMNKNVWEKGDIFERVTGNNYGDMKYEDEGEHRILLSLAIMAIHNIVLNNVTFFSYIFVY